MITPSYNVVAWFFARNKAENFLYCSVCDTISFGTDRGSPITPSGLGSLHKGWRLYLYVFTLMSWMALSRRISNEVALRKD